jgi:hypothetical protein
MEDDAVSSCVVVVVVVDFGTAAALPGLFVDVDGVDDVGPVGAGMDCGPHSERKRRD